MKKFYAIMAAALFSVSMFAANPTKADLQSFVKDGHYVACFSTPAEGTCNDIVWIGTYCDWTVPADLSELVQCQKLNGFDGWYVAVVPVKKNDDGSDGENSGKPVQLNECGKFDWNYQNGVASAIELVSGSVDIVDNGAESDLKNWSTTEPTIITMTAWKNSPCGNVCNEKQYTIRVYQPFCEENPEFEPSIMGSFNLWTTPLKMKLVGGKYFEAVTPLVSENLEFKFNNNPVPNEKGEADWSNQFEFYTPEDEENDVPAKWSQFGNFTLDPENEWSKYYNREGEVLTFDFSDPEKYRYAMCGVDTNTYKVVLIAKFPADSLPEAGIEVMGNFGGDATWENGVMMEFATPEPGIEYYITTKISAKAAHEFKFREAGDPDWNQVVTISDGKDLQFKFGDKWEDDKWKGEDVKLIELDLSDPTKYCWKTNWVAPEGIEDVVLTENAQKVVVDGVLYIVRDNKMFTIQGAQVR